VGRARKKLKPIQVPSPEMWSETISGSEEVLAEKWGGLVWTTPLEKIIGGVTARTIPPRHRAFWFSSVCHS
jgi:hypothetical protein